MDNKIKLILEQINFNLESISLYIEKLSTEEIKLDDSKIYLIDYSTYKWLNRLDNKELKNRLEEYNQQSANNIINDDFVEFCRHIYLQIESLLDTFIDHNFSGDIQVNNYTKINKLKFFFERVRGGKNFFKAYEDKEYKKITHIMDIRDIASHADSNGRLLKARVEAKGKSMIIKLQKLDENVAQELIENIFSEFVINKNKRSLIVTLRPDGKGLQYAYIRLFNLNDKYLKPESVLNYITTNLNLFKYRLGNGVQVSLHKEQPINELKIFFEKKDYTEIKQTLNWFIQQIGNHLT